MPALAGQDSAFGRFKNLFKSDRTVNIGGEDFVVDQDGHIAYSNFQEVAVFPEEAMWIMPGG